MNPNRLINKRFKGYQVSSVILNCVILVYNVSKRMGPLKQNDDIKFIINRKNKNIKLC